MSNPDNAAAQTIPTGKEPKESFADQVNNAVSAMTVNDNGLHILPDGLEDNVRVAAEAEKRRRDTQSSFSKSQQALKVAQAENDRLRGLIVPQLKLTAEQKEELFDLKESDPDAWREKLSSYEAEAEAELGEKLKKVKTESSAEAEVARRAQVLEDFLTANPEFTINDDVLANDIPPRIKNKLISGEATFEQFLIDAKEYLGKNKVPSMGSGKEPDLNSTGGGANATSSAVKEDIISSYESEIY